MTATEPASIAMNDAIADNPQPKPAPFRFTRENARELALKGNQIRWSRERAKAESPEVPAIQPSDSPTSNPHAPALERLQGQLDKIDELLEKAKTAPEWRDLTSARERIFKQWAHLAGIPGPGNLKPSARGKARSPAAIVEPTEPAGPGPAP